MNFRYDLRIAFRIGFNRQSDYGANHSMVSRQRSVREGSHLEVVVSIKGGKCEMASWAICLVLSVSSASEPTITTAAGTGRAGESGDGGPAESARLNMPFDVAFDGRGNLFFSDTFNHRIRRIDHSSGTIATVAGTGKAGFSGDGGLAVQGQLNEPYGIVVDKSGNLFVADRLNRRVRRIDGITKMMTTVAGDGRTAHSGDGGPGPNAGIVEPNGIALSRDESILFIADVAGNRVRALSWRQATSKRSPEPGATATMATAIAPIALRSRAHAPSTSDRTARYTSWNERGMRFGSSAPRVARSRQSLVLGRKGYTGDGGPAKSAAFNGPKELAVDAVGNIWIVDTENHAIRFIDANTQRIRTVAGTGSPGGDGDGGSATKARLDRPHGIAIGPDGSCWIADTNNHRLRSRHAGSLRYDYDNTTRSDATLHNRPIAQTSRSPVRAPSVAEGTPCPDHRGPLLGRTAERGCSATAHEVEMPDGDRLLVLETVPPAGKVARPTAVLVHGLAGSADASYVVRVGQRLVGLGIRVVRVNLRGAGAGFGLARGIYHAGRSDDLREVVNWLDAAQSGLTDRLDRLFIGCEPGTEIGRRGSADVPLQRT